MFDWSNWIPLRDGLREVASRPGLYRVRQNGADTLTYIGQTGRSLRERLGALRAGVYSELMPYRDPHVAAPALWALRDSTGCEFEASTTVMVGTDQWRKGMEAVAIALARQESGESPTVNFGRMPPGYEASSGRNARLAAAGKQRRGRRIPEGQAAPDPDPTIAPRGALAGDPTAPSWGGLEWSDWRPFRLSMGVPIHELGLYRIRAADQPALLYIGEGGIRDRLRAHAAKVGRPTRQGMVFAQQDLEFSYVTTQRCSARQRRELETDLIAAHVIELNAVPLAQFLGR